MCSKILIRGSNVMSDDRIKTNRDRVEDVLTDYIDEEKIDEVMGRIEEWIRGYAKTNGREPTKRELQAKELYDMGADVGTISRELDISFQNARYYVLKFASNRDNTVYRNLKDIPKVGSGS